MTKICSSCEKERDIDEFSSDRCQPDGTSYRCKKCQRKASRLHYLKYKEGYQKRQKKRRLNAKNFIDSVKKQIGCSFCDESDPVCLDFHHEGYEEKSFCIITGASSNIEKLSKEMKKCIVVCANCHRKIHSKEYIET